MSTLVFGTQVCVAVRPGVGLDFLFCVSLWASKSNSFMEPGAPQPVAQKQLWKRERLEEHWRKYGTSQKPEPIVCRPCSPPRVFYKIFSGFHSFFRLHWMFQSSTSKVLLGKQKPKIFTKSKAWTLAKKEQKMNPHFNLIKHTKLTPFWEIAP